MGILMIKKMLQRIFWLGIYDVGLYEDAKRIEFSNQISLFYAIIALLYVFIFLWIGSYRLMGLVMANMLAYVLCLFLNKWRQYRWSSLMIIFNATLSIYLATAIIGRDISGQFFLVFLFPLVHMLFSAEQKLLKRLCLLMPVLAFIVLEVSDYQFFYKVILVESVLRFISVTVFVMTSIILYFMFQFYMTIFQHVRNSLNQMVSLYPLTEREIEIISVIMKGKNNKETAQMLFIEECTVKTHLKSIFKKFNVKSRHELMAKCMSVGRE